MFKLATQFLRRDYRSGALWLIFLSLMFAVACMTTMGLFSDRVAQTLKIESNRLLGADVVISSPTPVPQNFINQANKLKLAQAKRLLIYSMASHEDRFKLVDIQAVGDQFPLRGNIQTKSTRTGQTESYTKGPEAGNIWVQESLLSYLNIKLGQSIDIGDKALKITKIIQTLPQSQARFINFAPLVLMNLNDVKPANIIQPGSRIKYQLMLKEQPEKIQSYLTWANAEKTPDMQVISPQKGGSLVTSRFGQAAQFLNLAALCSLLLAGIVIYLSTQHYVAKHATQFAVIRCFGVSQNQILHLYLILFGLLAVIASGLGALVGTGFEQGLMLLINHHSNISLGHATWTPIVVAFTFGVCCLMLLAIPALLKLRAIPIMQVFRSLDITATLKLGFVAFSMVLLILLFSGWMITNIKLTLLVTLVTFILIFGLYFFIRLLLWGLYAIHQNLPLSWRYAIRQLYRYRTASIVQMVSLSLVFVVMICITLVHFDIQYTWQRELPKNTPNIFAINISQEQIPLFGRILKKTNIKSEGIYPVIRGRLARLNGQPIMNAIPESGRKMNALHRALNLTWHQGLPKDNKVTQGTWWSKSAKPMQISVEARMAKELDIKLGDKLSFDIADQQVTGTVTNIRTVNWMSFQPNFYIIFSPGSLNHLENAAMTSFYLPISENQLLSRLLNLFPNITIIDAGIIIKSVLQVVNAILMIFASVNIFTLFISLLVLLAALLASLTVRRYNAAILSILGAKKAYILRTLMIEMGIQGAIAGLTAAVIALVLRALILRTLFGWQLDGLSLLILVAAPLAGILLMVIAARVLGKHYIKQSPKRLLLK